MQKTWLFQICSTALLSSSLALMAQSGISTHIINSEVVSKIGTSLNHISVIEMPEPIVGATVGSDLVSMEYRDKTVLIEPLKPGVQTNLFVWTAHSRTTYEVLPAGDPSALSYSIRETYAPPPTPPPGPTPEEAQTERDRLHDTFMMTVRNIKARHYKETARRVHLRVLQVAEDQYAFYVRLRAVNATPHLYRIDTPVVSLLSPLFGERMALRSMNEQLTDRKFAQVEAYDAYQLSTHGSTLVSRDLRSGEAVEWVMALKKPQRSRSMFEFTLPTDDGDQVHAVVVF